MKRFLFFVVAVLVSWCANAQTTELELNIDGLDDGTQLSIMLAGTLSNAKAIQTVGLENGKAVFETVDFNLSKKLNIIPLTRHYVTPSPSRGEGNIMYLSF